MHATTSPTINQPRFGGVRAFSAAVGLAAAIAAGAVIGVATAPTATIAPPAAPVDDSVRPIHPTPAVRGGSLTRGQRIVREQRLARLYRVVQGGDQMRYWDLYAQQRGAVFRTLPLRPMTRQEIEPRLPGLLGEAVYAAISARVDPGNGASPGLSHR